MSGKSDENKSFKSNQLAPSIYIMIELCFFSLDQWEIRIHLLSVKSFNIPHDCDPHLDHIKFNWLLHLTIHGVLGKSKVSSSRSYVYLPAYTQGIEGLNRNQHVTVWNCFPSILGMNLDQKIVGIYTSTWDLRNI